MGSWGACYTSRVAKRTLSPPAPASALAGVVRLVLALLALLALLASASLILRNYLKVSEVELPDLIGVPIDEAQRALRALGLEPLTFSEAVPDAPQGTVVSQSPGAGTVVLAGRSVSLGVSQASDAVRVPDLRGSTQEQAATLMSDMALAIGDVSFVFSELPEGQIVEQSPASGESLRPGATVDLVVSRGPDIAAKAVPDLTGMNIEAAKRRLQELGFTNVDTLAASVSFDEPFTVTDQAPQADEEVSPAARITLFYSLSTDTVVQVPDLAGLPLGRAQLLLRASGLALGGVSYLDDPAQPGGVVAFEPQGHTLRDTPVSVTVNRAGAPAQDALGDLGGGLEGLDLGLTPGAPEGDAGVPDAEPTAPVAGDAAGEQPLEPGERVIRFDFDPRSLGMTSLQREAYQLTVVVKDDRGERTVIDQVVPAGQPVNTSVTVYGEALLQTFLNGIFFQAWNP